MNWVICALFVVLLSSVAHAEKGSITLLALIENGSAQAGTVANLELELIPGKERVFLETFPMTKITTQASLRFAQQMACRELEFDCSGNDFLFSIKALPGIIGGPSAGGAAALLVSSILLNKTVPSDIAMTGTINSGGTIGPVGGLKQKVEAAAGNGIKTVFLPKGTSKFADEDNKTVDLIEYGRELNLTVIEVATIGEVLELALGVPQNVSDEPLVINERYSEIMKQVAGDLCERNKELNAELLKADLELSKNFTKRSEEAMGQGAWYSAASYCFRANVEYKREWYAEKNFSLDELKSKVSKLKSEIKLKQGEVEARNVSTLTDIQTFMAVMERLNEASELLKLVEEGFAKNSTADNSDIGFAEERLFSADTWGRFFDGQDKLVVVNDDVLRSACAAKISEAEERYNYVKSILPEALDATRGDIDEARNSMNKGKNIMCLYGASKAKSEADVLLNLMGVEEDRFDEVISLKLNVTRQALIKAQKKNIFPIIAYSYYEYAGSLRDFDRVSSILFTEYALELANLDIYFEDKVQAPKMEMPNIPSSVFAFLIGAGLGGFFVWIIACQLGRHQTLQAPSKRRLRGKKR